ncbi:hypothetical protein cyc_07325 [Cyclospora cayetanensis]|uniref:Uncharacterized protein n=1 Tax=Cyclospora cayetanensis TaxID=88456 RepID=A0A1D3D610_9EIME|nr:hypothetical protein cyc_07325 [Cyclospora cayetanensis]
MASALVHTLLLQTEGTATGDACFSVVSLLASGIFCLDRHVARAFILARNPLLLFSEWFGSHASKESSQRAPRCTASFGSRAEASAVPAADATAVVDPAEALAALWGGEELSSEEGSPDWENSARDNIRDLEKQLQILASLLEEVTVEGADLQTPVENHSVVHADVA